VRTMRQPDNDLFQEPGFLVEGLTVFVEIKGIGLTELLWHAYCKQGSAEVVDQPCRKFFALKTSSDDAIDMDCCQAGEESVLRKHFANPFFFQRQASHHGRQTGAEDKISTLPKSQPHNRLLEADDRGTAGPEHGMNLTCLRMSVASFASRSTTETNSRIEHSGFRDVQCLYRNSRQHLQILSLASEFGSKMRRQFIW
jgi:hypothetical protein